MMLPKVNLLSDDAPGELGEHCEEIGNEKNNIMMLMNTMSILISVTKKKPQSSKQLVMIKIHSQYLMIQLEMKFVTF